MKPILYNRTSLAYPGNVIVALQAFLEAPPLQSNPGLGGCNGGHQATVENQGRQIGHLETSVSLTSPVMQGVRAWRPQP